MAGKLLNKKAVKGYFHDIGKRVSDDALLELETKVRVLCNKTAVATNGAKTIKASDVDCFCIKMKIT